MASRSKKAILVGVVIIAVFFSFYKLKESPSVWYDEGMYIQAATNLADGYGSVFQFAPGYLVPIPALTVGYPVIYPLALLFKIFGSDILVARGMMVFFLLSFALSAFILIKKRYGMNIALCSLALIATFPPLYGNGKSVLGEVPALLFMALCLIALEKALSGTSREKVRTWLIVAGFLAGIAAAAKLLFLLFLPAFALAVILAWRQKKIFFSEAVLAGISAALPILVYLFVQFHGASSATSLTGFYANPYGVHDLLNILKQNVINFFTAAGPLYLLLMMAAWAASVIVRKIKKENISTPELASFTFCVLTIGSYLRIVGWFRYIFPAQMIALIYFAPSLNTCTEWFSSTVASKMPLVAERLKRYFVFGVVIALSLWGIYGLMFNSWVAETYGVHKTAFWQDHFNYASSTETFFFYDAPEVVIFDQNRNYYQFMPLPTAGGPFGSEYLDMIVAGGVDEIVIRTDTLASEGSGFLKHYRLAHQVYKYSILEKIK